MKYIRIIVLVIVALTVVIGSAYFILKSQPAVVPIAGLMGSSQQIRVNISLSKIPKLNEPFFINTSFESLLDEPDLEGHVDLPSGAIYIDGDWKYRGPAKKGNAIRISTKAAIVEEGKWIIAASAEAGEYQRLTREGTPERKPWYPVYRGHNNLRLETTSQGGTYVTDSSLFKYTIVRPQPKTFNVKAGDPIPMAMVGYIVGTELINNTDQQFFLLIHDKAGIQNLRNLGLVPQQLWGPWGPFLTQSLWDVLHTDFNLNFVILVIDKKRPTTGYRFFMEGMEYTKAARMQGWDYTENSLTIRVRTADPPAGITTANRPVSPYDVMVLSKDFFKSGQPVAAKFLFNAQVVTQQSIVIRKTGQGIINSDDIYGREAENFRNVAKQSVAQFYNIPANNLERIPFEGPSGQTLMNSIHVTGYRFKDKYTDKFYDIMIDAYGRVIEEKDLGRLQLANSRAKLALAFDGVDPELNDLLQKQLDSYITPVEIWFRPNVPGATYADAGRSLIQALNSINAQPEAAKNLPMLKANLTKKNIHEIALREDVAVIMKSRGN